MVYVIRAQEISYVVHRITLTWERRIALSAFHLLINNNSMGATD